MILSDEHQIQHAIQNIFKIIWLYKKRIMPMIIVDKSIIKDRIINTLKAKSIASKTNSLNDFFMIYFPVFRKNFSLLRKVLLFVLFPSHRIDHNDGTRIQFRHHHKK